LNPHGLQAFHTDEPGTNLVTEVNKKLIVIAAILIIASIVAYNYLIPAAEIEGTIRVSGAFALYPMMVKWAEEYQKLHPKVKIEVSAGGAGKGMTDALAGLVDIGMVSRDIYPEEITKGAFYVIVTKDAVVAIINADNPVINDILTKGITKQTFYNMFVAGNVTTWGQVVGRPDVTDKINVYTRSDACGAADNWAKYLGSKQEDLRGIGVYGDPGVVEVVKKDRLGIVYSNIAYSYDMKTKAQADGISVVPIDVNENGRIDSDEDFYKSMDQIGQAILSDRYPTPPARVENLVTKGKFTGVTKEFVKWILTDGQKFVQEAGYVPLPADVVNEQLARLES
jgi:phosphate transport system substrate-binding protein